MSSAFLDSAPNVGCETAGRPVRRPRNSGFDRDARGYDLASRTPVPFRPGPPGRADREGSPSESIRPTWDAPPPGGRPSGARRGGGAASRAPGPRTRHGSRDRPRDRLPVGRRPRRLLRLESGRRAPVVRHLAGVDHGGGRRHPRQERRSGPPHGLCGPPGPVVGRPAGARLAGDDRCRLRRAGRLAGGTGPGPVRGGRGSGRAGCRCGRGTDGTPGWRPNGTGGMPTSGIRCTAPTSGSTQPCTDGPAASPAWRPGRTATSPTGPPRRGTRPCRRLGPGGDQRVGVPGRPRGSAMPSRRSSAAWT